ncbi:MAG TPA: IS3 family transposase [Balneolaceae bacterium]|nr:IS3 family transposase [Balneolaceae bacterium]
MDNHRHLFPISKMSQTLGVSRSGYYRWKDRPPSKSKLENKRLIEEIRRIWLDSGKTYGSPRIHRKLKAHRVNVSRPRVARLMRKAGIASQIRRKWTQTTDSAHTKPVAENLLARDFKARQVSQKWVSDITYLPSRHGWLYLTTVMDLADRQIIGWSLSSSMEAEQTSIAAWKAACRKRPPSSELIFHSDRGIQYACGAFTDCLQARSVTQSMSRKGNCWDNAPAESFFKTFKAELLVETSQCSYNQIRRVVFNFIEIWYNRKRLHSSLDYRTPAEMQQFLIKQQAA